MFVCLCVCVRACVCGRGGGGCQCARGWSTCVSVRARAARTSFKQITTLESRTLSKETFTVCQFQNPHKKGNLQRRRPSRSDGQSEVPTTSCDQFDLGTHTPSTAFRHLPPNSAKFSYATEGALFMSAQLSTDAVSALRKVRVLI